MRSVVGIAAGCAVPENAFTDTGECWQTAGRGCLTVAAEDTCPAPAAITPFDLRSEYDCDDTVIGISSSGTPPVEACSFLLGCDVGAPSAPAAPVLVHNGRFREWRVGSRRPLGLGLRAG